MIRAVLTGLALAWMATSAISLTVAIQQNPSADIPPSAVGAPAVISAAGATLNNGG